MTTIDTNLVYEAALERATGLRELAARFPDMRENFSAQAAKIEGAVQKMQMRELSAQRMEAWERDDELGDAADCQTAAMHGAGRWLDMETVRRGDGGETWWCVVDGPTVVAEGYTTTTDEARRAAERAARQALIRPIYASSTALTSAASAPENTA